METFLILAEDSMTAKLCQMVLGKSGLPSQVISPSTLEINKILSQAPPSLIVLELHEKNGQENPLLHTFESHPKLRNIPILGLSATKQNLTTLKKKIPALFAHFVLPFTPAKFLHAIEQILSRDPVKLIEDRRAFLQKTTSTSPVGKKTKKPALQGQIEGMPVSEILQIIQMQGHTGVFQIKAEQENVWIYFERGCVQWVKGKNFSDEFLLGQILIQNKHITPPELKKTLSQTKKTTTALGQYLVQQKQLKEEHLKEALKEQSTAFFFELLNWKEGEFTFENLAYLPESAQFASLGLRLESLLLEGFRRLDEFSIFEREIGPMETVLERNAQPTAVLENLSPLEKSILHAVNGSSTLKEIAQNAYLSRFDLYKACHHLVTQEIVRPRNHQNSSSQYDA